MSDLTQEQMKEVVVEAMPDLYEAFFRNFIDLNNAENEAEAVGNDWSTECQVLLDSLNGKVALIRRIHQKLGTYPRTLPEIRGRRYE